MNTNEIIQYIIARLSPDTVTERRDPNNWVKSTTKDFTYQGTTYFKECYECMENYGLEPTGLIATVVLDAQRQNIIEFQILNLADHVDEYSRMMETFYGIGIDNLRKN